MMISLTKWIALSFALSAIGIQFWLMYGLYYRFLLPGGAERPPFLSLKTQKILAWYLATAFIVIAILTHGMIVFGFSTWLIPLLGVLAIRSLGKPNIDPTGLSLMRFITFSTALIIVGWVIVVGFSNPHFAAIDATVVAECLLALIAATISGVLAGTTVFYWRQLI